MKEIKYIFNGVAILAGLASFIALFVGLYYDTIAHNVQHCIIALRMCYIMLIVCFIFRGVAIAKD